MVKQSLWAEITICGYLFLAGIIFSILFICQIHDISFLLKIEPYIALLSIVSIIFSYFLGFIFHRSITLIPRCITLLLKKIGLRSGNENRNKRFSDDLRKKIKIINYGNERFLLELDYQFNHKVVSQLILYGLPFLLISFTSWRFLVYKYDLTSFIILICVSIFMIIWLWRIKNYQKSEYDRLLNLIYHEIYNERNSTQS